MRKKKTTNSEELYGELGQAFNFTQGDLEANRAGFISYRQGQVLKFKTYESLFKMSLPITLFLLLAVVFAFNAFREGEDFAILCIAAPFGLIAFVFIAISIVTYSFVQMDISQRTLKDAICELQVSQQKGDVAYWLYGNVSFKIATNQAAALKAKHKYLVHYAEKSNEILAIEDAE
jgi:hypothetical protein